MERMFPIPSNLVRQAILIHLREDPGSTAMDLLPLPRDGQSITDHLDRLMQAGLIASRPGGGNGLGRFYLTRSGEEAA